MYKLAYVRYNQQFNFVNDDYAIIIESNEFRDDVLWTQAKCKLRKKYRNSISPFLQHSIIRKKAGSYDRELNEPHIKTAIIRR